MFNISPQFNLFCQNVPNMTLSHRSNYFDLPVALLLKIIELFTYVKLIPGKIYHRKKAKNKVERANLLNKLLLNHLSDIYTIIIRGHMKVKDFYCENILRKCFICLHLNIYNCCTQNVLNSNVVPTLINPRKIHPEHNLGINLSPWQGHRM